MPSDLNVFFLLLFNFFIVIYTCVYIYFLLSGLRVFVLYNTDFFYLVYIFIECCPVRVHYANRLNFNVLCNDTFKTTCTGMSNVYLFLSVLLLYVLCRPMSENSSAELMFMFIGNRL